MSAHMLVTPEVSSQKKGSGAGLTHQGIGFQI